MPFFLLLPPPLRHLYFCQHVRGHVRRRDAAAETRPADPDPESSQGPLPCSVSPRRYYLAHMQFGFQELHTLFHMRLSEHIYNLLLGGYARELYGLPVTMMVFGITINLNISISLVL
ncbi:uncharacterized protein LOC122054065 [Zingiber officinale]|uniref:uncharacterized protein LOC122054065 n=1 Tax=Zingiber officinale TaxID=94328 RepID=UPI001C4DD02B|nr:uncharacterized protein LOC122054065 [Zingiber officinale]